MKNLLFLISLIFLMTSCKKEVITPGNYTTTQPSQNNNGTSFTNGGTTPTWGNTTTNNDLVGTSWILIKVKTGAGVTTTYSDTLHFKTNTLYTVGSDTANKYQYVLQTVQNNVSLTFQPLEPINSLQCSTNQLGVGFAAVPSGTVIFATFTDPYNINSKFTAWFKKI